MNVKLLLTGIMLTLPISSCFPQNEESGSESVNKSESIEEKTSTVEVDNSNAVIYKKSDVILNSFDGLGVEWGVYEDTNKLVSNAWDKIESAVDRLNPKLVRCMTNFDWIVENFDNKGNDDINDDTWTYNFNNKYMLSACQILDYCQEHNIKVAFGVWNVIGSVGEDDIWGMVKNSSADIRWAKMTADLLDYLVNQKGYDCIKWFVSTNEPNYTGAVGASKNAYNTYTRWETGVKNVRKALDDIGLTNIDIVGGDTTGFIGSIEYLPQIATNISDVVNNYGVHMYISNYDIDKATYQENLTALYNGVKEIDSSLGVSKNMHIWEAGLLDGKNVSTDCNAYIGNFSYGIRMADYTVQSLLSGINGVVYWDLDDAMHFMYTESGMSAKEWGMFSTLSDASMAKQELRPWYHSSTLLTNLLEVGSKVYKGTYEVKDDSSFRTMAVVNPGNTNAGFVAINRSSEEITKNFKIEKTITNEENKLYVYIFNEQNLRLGADGYVVENFVIDGSINNKTTLKVPANSMVVVSTRRL